MSLGDERIVLSALMRDVDPAPARILRPEDFSHSFHRNLFSTMMAMLATGEPLDAAIIIDRAHLGEMDIAYLGELLDPLYLVPEKHLGHCVRRIKRDAVMRDLKHMAGRLAEANGEFGTLLLELKSQAENYFAERVTDGAALLGSFTMAELFDAGTEARWLAWPFAASGLSTIVDAHPKTGKTRFYLEAIRASRESRLFLAHATQPMRTLYVSEQSKPMLAIQARECGFTREMLTGDEFRCLTREHWFGIPYAELLERIEKQFLETRKFNTLIIDTWHSIANLEDERDASEVNKFCTLTLALASKYDLALSMGRHERKSGGDVGLSGRSSSQLTGLADVILQLAKVPNKPTQRKLVLAGRVSLPAVQLIDLVNGSYLNWGSPEERNEEEERDKLDELLTEEPTLDYRTIEDRTGIKRSRVKAVAQSAGWAQVERGLWQKRES